MSIPSLRPCMGALAALLEWLSIFPISLAGAAGEWFKKDCIGSVTTWDDLVEKFVQKFYQLSDHNEEIEEDDDHDDITDIFKIEGNLFDFETPLCEAFNNFNYLLKIDKDSFTFDIQGTGTYEEYELNNHVTRDLEEQWLDNGVPYQLCDHICEPYRFKNGATKHYKKTKLMQHFTSNTFQNCCILHNITLKATFLK
ncbi:hypothetical protein Tco_0586357 [Tanacetum coccineum]